MSLKSCRRKRMLTTRTSQASQEPTVARPRKPTIELPPHVNVVRVKGRPYYYFHPGRGTKNAKRPIRLPDDPRSEDFWAAYGRLTNDPQRENAKSFTRLIDAYRTSPEFCDLADSTRTNYEHYLETIAAAWGNLSVDGLLPAHVLALRDKHRGTPAAANGMLRVLSVLISWSVPRGFRSDNPCTHVRKLKIGDGWAAWPWEMIELVRQVGPAWMWQATALALYTGQRQGDVLHMTWGAVKGGLVEVRQEKTGKHLVIPAHQDLLAVIAEVPRHSTRVLTNTRGLPWTKSGFKASWQKALKGPLATIREHGLVFHGLRKSAVVTLLEAGATEAEVAAITGQSLHMVAHYARQVNQRKLAASAILKWERAGNANLQNRLQNSARESD
jgi:integrase